MAKLLRRWNYYYSGEAETLFRAYEAQAAKRLSMRLSAALGVLLDCLVGLHGREKVGEWKALARAGEWRELVSRLLLDHYDAAYRRSAANNFPRLSHAQAFPLNSAEQSAIDLLAAGILRTREEAVSA